LITFKESAIYFLSMQEFNKLEVLAINYSSSADK